MPFATSEATSELISKTTISTTVITLAKYILHSVFTTVSPALLPISSSEYHRENNCICSENGSSSVITVSSVSLLLIVPLTTIIFI